MKFVKFFALIILLSIGALNSTLRHKKHRRTGDYKVDQALAQKLFDDKPVEADLGANLDMINSAIAFAFKGVPDVASAVNAFVGLADKKCNDKNAEIIPSKDGKKISLNNLVGQLQFFGQREHVVSGFIKKVNEKFANKKDDIKPLEDKLAAVKLNELANQITNACKKSRKSRKNKRY